MPEAGRPARSARAGQRFETSEAPPGQQTDFWRALVHSRFRMKMDVEPPEPGPQFHGAMVVQSAGILELLDISGDPVEVVRKSRHITSADPELVAVHMPLVGNITLEQQGRVARLAPGDLGYIETARSFHLRFSRDHRFLTLVLPRGQFLARLGTRALPTATRLDGKAGLGALAGSFVRTLDEQLGTLDADGAALAAEQATSLLSLAFGHPASQHDRPGQHGDEPRSAQHARLRQVQHYIEEHLTEPDLSPSRVAAANRISGRYLYKLFEDAGSPVADWIRERRLVRCAEALASPALADRGIADLALSWGFNDLSHFSRAFKRRFELSPRAYRRAALARALADQPGHA